MQTGISKGFVNRNLRYAAELNLVYLNNPKAGCSTIKYSLWMAIDDLHGRQTFRGNVHARKVDPFVRDIFELGPDAREKFSRASLFSVVRNPFSRVLAAYLDKIPNDPSVWENFHESFGLRPELTKKDFSFGDFLRLIDAACPELLDGHFRPQTDNLLQPYLAPHFVGCLEDMKSVEQFLAGAGVALQTHVRHATKSAENLNAYYDTECLDLIRKIYAEDFVVLGYSINLGDAKSPARFVPDRLLGTDHVDAVRRWVMGGEPPAGAVADLPDLRAFERTKGRERKTGIVKTALASDCDWARLWRYAKYSKRRLEENELSEAILEKMRLLRTRYELAVRNRSIFRPIREIGRRR